MAKDGQHVLKRPLRCALCASFPLSTFTVKQQSSYQQNGFVVGRAEELQFGTGKLWQAIGISGDLRKGTLLHRERRSWEGPLGMKVHWRKARAQRFLSDSVVLFSYCPSLLLGEKKIFLPPAVKK